MENLLLLWNRSHLYHHHHYHHHYHHHQIPPGLYVGDVVRVTDGLDLARGAPWMMGILMIYKFNFLLWLYHGGLWLTFNNSNLIVVQISLQLLILAGDKLQMQRY